VPHLSFRSQVRAKLCAGARVATTTCCLKSCSKFACPQGLTKKKEPEKAICDKGICSPAICCNSPTTTPCPTTTLLTCHGYKCPHPLTIRYQPDRINCPGKGGCSPALLLLGSNDYSNVHDYPPKLRRFPLPSPTDAALSNEPDPVRCLGLFSAPVLSETDDHSRNLRRLSVPSRASRFDFALPARPDHVPRFWLHRTTMLLATHKHTRYLCWLHVSCTYGIAYPAEQNHVQWCLQRAVVLLDANKHTSWEPMHHACSGALVCRSEGSHGRIERGA
jgi:hypothetical protein